MSPSIFSVSILKVFSFTSQNFGVALQNRIEFTDAINENEGIITSSFSLIPSERRPK